jgi:hypothetical protein
MTSMTSSLEALTVRLAEAKTLLDEIEVRLAELAPQEQALSLLSDELSQLLGELSEGPSRPLPRLPAGWKPGMFAEGVQARVGPELSALGQSMEQMVNHLTELGGEVARHAEGIRRFTGQFHQALKEGQRLQLDQQHEATEILSVEVLETVSEERRRFGRGSQPPLKVILTAGGTRIAGTALDLGVGGLFVSTDEEVELGTLVHVSVELPSQSVVSGDGAVVWARSEGSGQRGLGIEFVAIDERTRGCIAAYSGEG